MRKIFAIALIFIAVTVAGLRCTDLKRDNPLDPANPESERSRIVLVEAFVNESTPFTPFTLSALDEIAAQTSREQTLILQYHLPSANYADDLATAVAKTRYDFYVTQDQAVPDVFFNGLRQRIQGAASQSTALKRYQTVLAREREATSHFTIEAKQQVAGGTLSVQVRLARLGETAFTDFFVQAVAYEDIGTAGHHFVVRAVLPAESVRRLDAGEIAEIDFTAAVDTEVNPQSWQAVVFIQQSSSKEIMQSTLAN